MYLTVGKLCIHFLSNDAVMEIYYVIIIMPRWNIHSFIHSLRCSMLILLLCGILKL